MLYDGQFWHLKKTFNEDNQSVLDEYVGLDNEPIVMPDGASAYAKEYDDYDNVDMITYLGADGEPITNTSGYAIVKRVFNKDKKITREAYYAILIAEKEMHGRLPYRVLVNYILGCSCGDQDNLSEE